MKIEVHSLALPDVKLIRSPRFGDRRGYFAETYVRRDFVAAGLTTEFVQDNQAGSAARGTVRGLHFQVPPFAQAKLVRLLRGSILDVVVDLRRSSPSYGRHLSIELDAERDEQLFVPAGFAHGYCTLEPETVMFYKVDKVYSAEHERGVNWADPKLGIQWPVVESLAVLSEKDRVLPALRELPVFFE